MIHPAACLSFEITLKPSFRAASMLKKPNQSSPPTGSRVVKPSASSPFFYRGKPDESLDFKGLLSL
jgi:hypothetical protein